MKRKEQFRKTAAALVSALMISFLPAVSAEEESRDYTGLQWYYSGEYGTIFPGWNTYDESGNAIPNVDPAKEIVIAVVDSGVDYTHEDLKNVMWDKGLEYPQLAALGGGKYGLNTLGGDPADPMDNRGHGTHVAGIIAAEWNHIGVSGALSGVKIMAVRATGGMTESVKKGFEYVLAAKRAGVNIAAVNLSWNGSVTFSMPEILNEVITELGKENVVTVIAAGNDGISHDEEMQVSTFLRSNPYVIEVASNDESGQISDFSNYGVHYTDVIAPGGHILSTVPDLSQGGSYEPEEFFPEEEFPEEELPEEVPGSLTEGEEKEEPQAEEPEETPTASLSLNEEGEAPFADPLYAYENGTSMAAPIVSAEAAYLYSLNPGMSAQERAAHVINTSKINSVSERKVYGGYADVSRAGTFAGWPYVSDTAYDYETGVLTVIGYDFGKGNGSLSIDGKQTSVKTWSDHKITAAVKNLAMGEHLITIQNGKEKKSRWMNISAESKDLKAVNTGLTGVSPSAMCVKGEDIYLAVNRSDGIPNTEFLRMKRGESSFTRIAAKERFGAVSAAAVDDLICFSDGNILLTMDGSGKNMQSTTLIFPDGYGMRPVIHSSGGRLFVTYSYGDSFYIGEADLSSGKISVLLQMALSSWRDAGFSEKDGVITFAVTGSEDYESSLMRVYRFVIGEEKAEQLFEIRNASVEAMDKASCLIKDQAVYLFGVTGTDQNNSWRYDLLEYTLEGEEKKRETLGGGHLHLLFAGEATENLIVLGTADAWKNNFFLLKKKVSGDPTPTPTPTPKPKPTPRPTPKPTPEPEPTEDPGRRETPVPPVIITCQDAGYPEGWYWDEARQACVAPAPAPTPMETPSGYTPPGSGITPAVPSFTPASTPVPSPDPITPIPAVTPSVTAAPIPEIPETQERTSAAKGSLYYLAEPVIMIIAGIAIALCRNTKAIPWIIGIDAVLGIIAAALDHSVLAWILLILNIAAVGLLGLYKAGRREEPESPEE